MCRSWEPEFFRLAGVWLACRVEEIDPAEPDPLWRLLGELDYQAEMGLLLREARADVS
jgi:hypothetical protein